MNHSAQRYNGIAISFHWIIAALILGMLALGKYMVSLGDDDPARFTLIQWHKSFGIVAMVLICCRLFWRATHKPPPPPGHLKTWENRAASTVHFLLYALIVPDPGQRMDHGVRVATGAGNRDFRLDSLAAPTTL